jgi:t-SNARE complex subunit (syntaxin)
MSALFRIAFNIEKKRKENEKGKGKREKGKAKREKGKKKRKGNFIVMSCACVVFIIIIFVTYILIG